MSFEMFFYLTQSSSKTKSDAVLNLFVLDIMQCPKKAPYKMIPSDSYNRYFECPTNARFCYNVEQTDGFVLKKNSNCIFKTVCRCEAKCSTRCYCQISSIPD